MTKKALQKALAYSLSPVNGKMNTLYSSGGKMAVNKGIIAMHNGRIYRAVNTTVLEKLIAFHRS